MARHIEWLPAYYVSVDSTAEPGVFADEGTENIAAAIRITSLDGSGIIIDGPPDQLVRVAEKILDEARLAVVLTNRSPQLRALYGRV